MGILDQNGTIIMVALIHDEYPNGFRPNKPFNFEMMVPVPPNGSDIKYNLFVDPFDECPEGLEGNVSETG